MRILGELSLVVGFSLLGTCVLGPRFAEHVHNANITQAAGDTRSLISANQAYASINCGLYARTLECMTRESETGICIPGFPPEAPEFLGPDLARPTPYVKSGYRRNYTISDVPEEPADGCAPESPRSFCYSAIPVALDVTGDRSFVGTASGEIYMDDQGGDTNCIPREDGAVGRDTPASMGPPPNALLPGETRPFSLGGLGRDLRRLFEATYALFLAVFVPSLVAYLLLNFWRKTA